MNQIMINKLKEFFNNQEDLQTFLNTPFQDLCLYHFTFGLWIRNNILKYNSTFLKECYKFGLNVDDISNSMIANFYIQLKR